ncbi:MAG: hypothetical protein AB1430_24990 [Pseudomonadota bacterium]
MPALPFDSMLFVALSVLIAATLRPWRMLRGPLLQPALAALVLLPLAWAGSAGHAMGMSLQFSGACLLVLLLGWPLATLLMPPVALAAVWLAGWSALQALDALVWLGLLPALGALGVGWLVRHALPRHPFVFLLGRAFFGTLLVLTLCGLARSWSAGGNAALAALDLLIGHWLLAWGEAIITGMLATALMVYRPQWLATFSDRLYLPPRQP